MYVCFVFKTEMADFAHKKHAAETMVKHYKEQISSIQAGIAELRARVVKEREQAEAAVLAAEEVCPRIETERSCQSIRLEVDKLQRYIEQECPRMEEKEMVATEYLRAMDRFKGTLQIIEDEKDALEVMSAVGVTECLMIACAHVNFLRNWLMG